MSRAKRGFLGKWHRWLGGLDKEEQANSAPGNRSLAMTAYQQEVAMDIKPIRTESDYREALKRIETLMDARENTPEGYLLDVLVIQVEANEKKHYPIALPDNISAIKFYMYQNCFAT